MLLQVVVSLAKNRFHGGTRSVLVIVRGFDELTVVRDSHAFRPTLMGWTRENDAMCSPTHAKFATCEELSGAMNCTSQP